MLHRFRNAVSNVVVYPPFGGTKTGKEEPGPGQLTDKYQYSRPDFLQLNDEEVEVSADHGTRPILVPRDLANLPWNTGYAEVINAGKTRLNEDQARVEVVQLSQSQPGQLNSLSPGLISQDEALSFAYFGVFDGHAGPGAALVAANCLHKHIQIQLSQVSELLIRRQFNTYNGEVSPPHNDYLWLPDKTMSISSDSLVIGALETAFIHMDDQIGRDRHLYHIPGGCAVIVAIFFMGKLYIANAGDCRAIMCCDDEVIPMSYDFNPGADRERIYNLAFLHPELLKDNFSCLEFPRRITRKDVGKKILFRAPTMKGWSQKVVQEEDIRFPLIYGDGRKTRLLATIGVARGFGDHDLKVYDSEINIKPFLSPMPQIQVYDISCHQHTADDFLVMASDGLWDVLTNEDAARIARKSLSQFEPNDPSRYTSAAQELILHARGLLKNMWRTLDDRPASGDDITVLLVPLNVYAFNPDEETPSAERNILSESIEEETS